MAGPRFTLKNQDFLTSTNPTIVNWKKGQPTFIFSRDKRVGWAQFIKDVGRDVTINNKPLTDEEKKAIAEIKDENTAIAFFQKKFLTQSNVRSLLTYYSQTPMLWASSPLGFYTEEQPMDAKISIMEPKKGKKNIFEVKGEIYFRTRLDQVEVFSNEAGTPLYNIIGPVEVLFKLNIEKGGYELNCVRTNSKILKKIYTGEIKNEAPLEKALKKKLGKSTAFLKQLPQKMRIIEEKRSKLATKLGALLSSKKNVSEETMKNLSQKIALLNACIKIYKKYSTDESKCSFSEFKTEINNLNAKMRPVPKTGILNTNKSSRQLIKELATEINELKVVPFFSTVEPELKDEKKAEIPRTPSPTNEADKVAAKHLARNAMLAGSAPAGKASLNSRVGAGTLLPYAAAGAGAGSPKRRGS